MRSDDVLLAEILDAARLVQRRMADVDEVRWAADDVLRDAVVHRLQVLGEAAARLSDSLREAHPQVPWRRMVAFRNVVVHEYFAVDWDTVRDVALNDLPPVGDAVSRILAKEFPYAYELWKQDD